MGRNVKNEIIHLYSNTLIDYMIQAEVTESVISAKNLNIFTSPQSAGRHKRPISECQNE